MIATNSTPGARVKVTAAPTSLHGYHVQTESFTEQWHTIQDKPLPWYAQRNLSHLT
jgi:hypothetical protein